ncbi:MAG: sulfur oxidation c-type cytochrome SoxX [Nitrospinae bacterium]|nr:sulfur oxidation c-type cytochrome SoxX [Nitrospinota bacterium]
MRKTLVMTFVAALFVVAAALSPQGWAQEKKDAKLGVEALKMSDAELFPDIPAPAKNYESPGGYTSSKENGFKIFSDVNQGNCAACHCADGVKGCGNIGPSLVKYKKDLGKERTSSWIYQKVADSRVDNPDTVMPPTITTSVLSAEQVADVAAFLESLK